MDSEKIILGILGIRGAERFLVDPWNPVQNDVFLAVFKDLE